MILFRLLTDAYEARNSERSFEVDAFRKELENDGNNKSCNMHDERDHSYKDAFQF